MAALDATDTEAFVLSSTLAMAAAAVALWCIARPRLCARPAAAAADVEAPAPPPPSPPPPAEVWRAVRQPDGGLGVAKINPAARAWRPSEPT